MINPALIYLAVKRPSTSYGVVDKKKHKSGKGCAKIFIAIVIIVICTIICLILIGQYDN